jgi:hypothetical protein
MTHTKIKLMSAAATLALIAAPAATAWEGAPAPIVLDQVQLNQTVSDLDVQVTGHANDALAASTAVGNSGAALFKMGSIDYDATQANHGDVAATGSLTGGNVGNAHAATTAYGNSSTAGTWMGNSYYRADQVMNGDTSASTTINLGATNNVAASTTAAANVSVSASEYGDNAAFQTQDVNGNVIANTDVDLCCANSSGTFVTTASGNVTSSSGSTSTSIVGAVQTTQAGTLIQAASDVYMHDGNDIVSAVTASGNSAVLTNEWGYASLGRQGSEVFQGNDADIDGQSYVTLDHWSGTATSSAYGVGNSSMVSNIGSDTALHTIQNNYGNVSTTASLTGQSWVGGAGHASAISIGNAASATLCNTCGDGVLSGTVSQYNAGNTTATTRMNTPHAGSVIGSASAIGNSATFTSNGD